MIVCWAVASPVCGDLSDRLGRRKPIYLAGCILAAIGWSAMFYIDRLPLTLFVIIGAFTGMCSGAVVLGFAYSKESVPAQYLGTISGTTNIGNMIGPTFLQPVIGWVLDRNWSGQVSHGIHVYGIHAYQLAFLLMVSWLVISSILLSFTQETYCAQSIR
jgi:MFS family permease